MSRQAWWRLVVITLFVVLFLLSLFPCRWLGDELCQALQDYNANVTAT